MNIPEEAPSLDERLVSAIESIAESLAALVEEAGGININTGEDSILVKTIDTMSDYLKSIDDSFDTMASRL